jgi:MoxR-like ATPase
MVVGASNRLPEDETLGALFDRFLLRVHCDNIPGDQLAEVLVAGWQLDAKKHEVVTNPISAEDIRKLQQQLIHVELAPLRPAYTELVLRLRQAGIPVSDRRAVKLQRLVAASALLCGRSIATRTDLWVLRYIWDTEEQREVLAAIVQEAVDKATEQEKSSAHPRSQGILPDPEALARDLHELKTKLAEAAADSPERAMLRDQLSILAGRIPWVAVQQQREHLQRQFEELWQQSGGTSA